MRQAVYGIISDVVCVQHVLDERREWYAVMGVLIRSRDIRTYGPALINTCARATGLAKYLWARTNVFRARWPLLVACLAW